MSTKKKAVPDKKAMDAEVALLKKMKPDVRHYTGFGDDNHAAIEAQILVIERGMDNDEIYDRWPDERDESERSCALEAREWLDGNATDGPPSEEWKPLWNKKG